MNGRGADFVKLLGHSDIKTTRRYAHTNREAKQKAVARLGVTLVTPPHQEGRIGLVTVFATAWEIS